MEDFKGYDLILLDMMLGLAYDGFELCARIRNEILTPIVFLTAKTMDEDVLKGFASGGKVACLVLCSLVEIRLLKNEVMTFQMIYEIDYQVKRNTF